VRFQLVKGQIRPATPILLPEEVLQRADAIFVTERARDLQDLIARNTADLRHYDVQGMDRVLAILMWGRSGSVLLASYLDGHDDVIMLPELSSQRLYQFYDRYPSMPLADKLICYAAYEPDYPLFFHKESKVSPTQYYAAVQAVAEFYRDWPSEFLLSRRAFFLFVHIAYNLALGRKIASPRPLIVYAQHVWDDVLAGYLVEDFPQAKFVHTIRDPISSCDGSFHFQLRFVENHILLPYSALFDLTNKDRPHSGMESRTRTIRFEDLHAHTVEIVRDLTEWLGLPYQTCLLDSTFNGVPYTVVRDGKSWSGRSLAQAQRQSRHISAKDRALLYASFYENFAEWDYSCPTIFKHLTVRCIVFFPLVLLPFNMEIVAARAVFKRIILPSLRAGRISPVIGSLVGIGLCRVKIIWLLARSVFRRCLFGTTLLEVDHTRRQMQQHKDGASVPRTEAKVE
jgi:hypothetical protein